jgi:hypothetical protein
MERARVLSVSERDRMISSLSNKLLEEKQLVSSAIKLVSRTKRLIFSLQEEKRKVQEELTATIGQLSKFAVPCSSFYFSLS